MMFASEAVGNGLPGTANPRESHAWWAVLALVMVGGAALRGLFLALRIDVLETEGQCYIRIAENLANGLGQLGIRAEGLQLFYPPLYPWLISLPIRLGADSATAAHAVSLIAGALLPLPVAILGRVAFSPAVGLVAAVVIAVHPALIVTSASTLGEALYFTLLATGVAGLVASLSTARWTWAGLAGVSAGLAYLVRPEGLAMFVLGLGVLAVGLRGSLRERGVPIAAFAAAFLVFAVPYVAYLSEATGRFRLETKSPENLLIGDRAARGMPEPAIYFGIAPDLKPTGTSLRSNLDVMQESDRISRDVLHFLRTLGARNMARGVEGALSSRVLGQPVLGLLVFLGIFAVPWPRQRLLAMAVPAGLAAATFAALATLHLFWVRYLFPLLPWLAVLAAAGLVTVAGTVQGTWTSLGGGARRGRIAGVAAGALLLAGLVVFASRGMHEIGEFSEAWSASRIELRVAGERLRGPPGSLRIADVDPTVAFYASATFEFFPFADPATAVRYLDHRQVDYIVLRPGDHMAPYVSEWYASGPPAGKATLAFAEGATRVYRWLR